MARKIEIPIQRFYGDGELMDSVLTSLKDRGLYDQNNLYRIFRIDEGVDVDERIDLILAKGTDRINSRRQSEEAKEISIILGREIASDQYLCLAPEIDDSYDLPQGLDNRLLIVENNFEISFFISVYDPKKMSHMMDYDYEFKDKENPQDALIALIQLYHQD